MPATLTQSPAARFPDGQSPNGLRAQLTTGLGGAYLRRDVPPAATADALHTRVMLAPRDAAGGVVDVMGVWSDAGDPVCWVQFDAEPRTITLVGIGVESAAVTLPPALDWHAVELRYDAAASSATCWLNGLEQHTIALDSGLDAESAWLGVLNKDAAMTGTIDLAYWAMGDAYLGPKPGSPAADHAGDPARWLVVYNTAVSDADSWAEYYRAARGIPYANLCGLDLPTAEVVSQAQLADLRTTTNDYLDRNDLTGQIMGVLLGFGAPGYVSFPGSNTETPITEMLLTDSPGELPIINPFYQATPGDRPTAGQLTGLRLTGRIDGKDLDEAIALIDRATVAMQGTPTPADARVWIDPHPGDPSISPIYSEPVLDWSASLEPARLRLPIEKADAEAGHDAVSSGLVVWGWRHAGPPAGFFDQAEGQRWLCLQFRRAEPVADSARDSPDGHWLRAAMDAGYAAASASSRPYDPASIPQPGPFFAALRTGWTLAEAWTTARPMVRDGLQLLGDPLMTMPFPKAGYDLFGPGPRLDAVDMDQPVASMHADQRSFIVPLEDWPDDGEIGYYRLRQIGSDGSHDAAATAIARQRIGDELLAPPPAPAWPDAEGWAVPRNADQLRLTLAWPTPPVATQIDSVEIERQDSDQSIATILSAAPSPRHVSCYAVDLPGSPARYRFVLRRGEAYRRSAWSAWIDPQLSLPAPPQTLEVLSCPT